METNGGLTIFSKTSTSDWRVVFSRTPSLLDSPSPPLRRLDIVPRPFAITLGDRQTPNYDISRTEPSTSPPQLQIKTTANYTSGRVAYINSLINMFISEAQSRKTNPPIGFFPRSPYLISGKRKEHGNTIILRGHIRIVKDKRHSPANCKKEFPPSKRYGVHLSVFIIYLEILSIYYGNMIRFRRPWIPTGLWKEGVNAKPAFWHDIQI